MGQPAALPRARASPVEANAGHHHLPEPLLRAPGAGRCGRLGLRPSHYCHQGSRRRLGARYPLRAVDFRRCTSGFRSPPVTRRRHERHIRAARSTGRQPGAESGRRSPRNRTVMAAIMRLPRLRPCPTRAGCSATPSPGRPLRLYPGDCQMSHYRQQVYLCPASHGAGTALRASWDACSAGRQEPGIHRAHH